jgi:2,4-dienoyl-CoA reductase-like NADH-dependent reductase (Old Yellow Enzyme family)
MKSLFDTMSLGGLELKNRLVRSATYEAMADGQGGVTDRLFDVYAKLADSRVGLIITSNTFVLPEGKALPAMLGSHDDALIDGYRRLTGRVHQSGGKIVMQLGFCGSLGFIKVPDAYSPSAVPEMATGHTGKEMSAADIDRLIGGFAAAAARAREAGFDGVQIHAATGFLLSQFLSPYYNRRTDQYGGPIENRMRLLAEIYTAVRWEVGRDFPVLVKINCADFIEDGLTAEDSLFVCRELAAKGIDAIEITGGVYAVREKTSVRLNVLTPDQEAYFSEYAAKVAASVDVPVILVGGLRSPEVMERVLHDTDVAYFAMCRPLIAEPGLVRRWQAGDREKAKCVSCNQCMSAEGVACRVL